MRVLVLFLIAALPADVRRGCEREIAASLDAAVAAARRRGRIAAAWTWIAEAGDLLRAAGSARLGRRPPLRPRRRKEPTMSMLSDLRHACRALAARPGTTIVAVVTLALAIGATTAIFSVVDTLMWRPLPYRGGDRLVEVWTEVETSKISNPGQSVQALRTLRNQDTIFERVEAYDFGSGVLLGGSEPDSISVVSVTPALLGALGATPIRGRLFIDSDGEPGAESTVILSEELWRSRFGSDPDVVGRTIEFDGDGRYIIIGVLPAEFRFPSDRTRAWTVLHLDGPQASTRPEVMAWLQPGLTREAAREMAAALDAGLRETGAMSKTRRLRLSGMRQYQLANPESTALLVVFGAVGLLLLVACTNVAGLLLAQGAARARDVAVLAALGAGRGRLARQFLTESLALGGIAGAAGALLAWLFVAGLVTLVPERMTFLTARPIAMDARVLAFAVVLSLATVLVFGLLPALRASRPDLVEALKSGSRTLSGSRGHRRLRTGLVVAELALAIVLLTGAGLLMRSFVRLQQVDPGFDPENLIAFSLQLPEDRYPSAEATNAFLRTLESRLEAMPGVTAATVATSLPPQGSFEFGASPEAEGEPPQDAGTLGIVPFASVSNDFFSTLRIPVLQGRPFAPGDPADAVVINESAALRYWGGRSSIGRRIRTGPRAAWLTVIAVVPDVKHMGLRDRYGTALQLYYPFDAKITSGGGYRQVGLRLSSPSAVRLADIKGLIWSLDLRLPVRSLMPVGEELAATIAHERFYLLLMSLFAALSLAISAVGIYGLMAYTVELRRQEIGIRMALGAEGRLIVRGIFRGALVLAAAGAALGLGGAAAGARVLQSLLYETPTADPLTFGAVALVLVTITLAAAWLPARRAARLDPLAVLRVE